MGIEKSMLVQNCLFRVGGAAMFLTNAARDRPRARYQLMTTVRTHVGADDLAYDSVFQMEDKRGEQTLIGLVCLPVHTGPEMF